MLEEVSGSGRAGGLQVDEGADLRGPLAAGHETVRRQQDGLLAAVEEEHQGGRQLRRRVRHQRPGGLQHDAHAGRAI